MKKFLVGFLTLSLAALACLHLACDGKNGATGPAAALPPTPSAFPHTFLGAWGTAGTAPGQFEYPAGLWVDGAADLFVSDANNKRIQEIPSVGNDYVTWGGPGTAPGLFKAPTGIVLDASGDLWVADQDNNRLQELPAGSGAWVTIGEIGTGPGQFQLVRYLAYDKAGDLYVSDSFNNRLQELPAGLAATVEANWVIIGTAGAGPGEFNVPGGIAFDTAGDLYVMDTGNSRIQELPGGKAATVASNWATFGSSGTGPGQFSTAFGLGTDLSGNLYVADSYNNRIQELPAGKAETVASNWVTFGSMGSGPGQFNIPNDVKTDSQGNVYVADSGNNRIEEFSP